MAKPAAPTGPEGAGAFQDHAVAIARRQYFQEGDASVHDMFRRVAAWVASPEGAERRDQVTQRFYDLMMGQRFCPGGRVLAGAATSHGNVLNCFVQDGRPEQPGSDGWVLLLATKLALVTKVGGGNGLNLDPIAPKRAFDGRIGRVFLTIDASHPDYQKVRTGTFLDLVRGEMVTRGYRAVQFVERNEAPSGVMVRRVADSVDDIWLAGGDMVRGLLGGEDVLVDLSDLRAEGTPVNGSGGTSSGPSSFAVEVYDNFAVWAALGGAEYAGPIATLRYIFAPTLRAIRQGGTRRGAGMATLSITHPDVHDFITAKDLEREQSEGDISTFNISVLVTDAFMQASQQSDRNSVLWEIARHAWATGEPGLIYIDRINEHNAMRASMGDILSTNPCGEIPLYPGEPCDLGAMNLAAYVHHAGHGLQGFDFDTFTADVKTCVRFLDNVLDVNRFALADNREMSMKLRRLGLGVMGMADALIRMGYGYDSEEGRAAVDAMISALRDAATEASEELAQERGAFPLVGESELEVPRRNVAVLTVAPTGTTSMLMGVSSGVEPVFAPFVYRKIGTEYHALIHPLFQELLDKHEPDPDYTKDGAWDWDKVVGEVQANHGSVQGLDFVPAAVRDVLRCAHDIAPVDHVKMQGVVQRAFDGGKKVANSISKTINLPNHATVSDVYDAYALAFATSCKGITVYRDGSREFQVLSTSSEKKDGKQAEKAAEQPAAVAAASDAVAVSAAAGAAGDAAQAGGLTGQSQGGVGATSASDVFLGSGANGTGHHGHAAHVAGPDADGAASAETGADGAPAPRGDDSASPGHAAQAAGAHAASAQAAGGQPSRNGQAQRGDYDRLPGEPLFDRPVRLSGFTDAVKLMMPTGEKRGFYVTVNKQDGLPSEVFIVSGKGGDEANADSEALGRVVSIALQYGVPAEALVKTLRGINGGMYGTYHGRMVASKADLLAVALETAGVDNVLNRGKACPDCGAPLRFEEGCQKCESCGYSKCG
ncbi:MAG: adenosylcobalamin-dependent ribonucleoside-diphosphate reductase [Trueperaceae bacterium]